MNNEELSKGYDHFLAGKSLKWWYSASFQAGYLSAMQDAKYS